MITTDKILEVINNNKQISASELNSIININESSVFDSLLESIGKHKYTLLLDDTNCNLCSYFSSKGILSLNESAALSMTPEVKAEIFPKDRTLEIIKADQLESTMAAGLYESTDDIEKRDVKPTEPFYNKHSKRNYLFAGDFGTIVLFDDGIWLFLVIGDLYFDTNIKKNISSEEFQKEYLSKIISYKDNLLKKTQSAYDTREALEISLSALFLQEVNVKEV